jgi:hypothetical protein
MTARIQSLAEHTPVPWAFDCEPNEITGKPFAHIWSTTTGRPHADVAYLTLQEDHVAANAAFIVKAVNGWYDINALKVRIAELEESNAG